ncbi:MAG: lysine--tRNA ligase [Patescibacteria group bacterium]
MNTIPSGRVDDNLFTKNPEHWADVIAKRVLESFPDLPLYTCAAGISPSGVVHFGNFRDVMTSLCVANALKKQGKNVRILFSWDEYDRFRKVPMGVPDSWREHIGKPLTSVPDPSGEFPSYAKRFETEFEVAMRELNIDLVYRFQTDEYTKGAYAERVIHAMKYRVEIADILLAGMSEIGKEEKKIDPEEYKKNFYPIEIYSRFTGNDHTEVVKYDGDAEVTYRCLDTNREETIDLRRDFIVKLVWKADWPMRWDVEGVVFEPGGKDHASPGSSFDVGSVIARKIYNFEPPVFIGYEFVGVQGLGAKMSGSKGNAVSPKQLLEIYEPSLLKWLYTRKNPRQAFTLAFDTEIYRQYDEFDRENISLASGALEKSDTRALEIAYGENKPAANPIPFKQAVAFGQILQWNEQKLIELTAALGLKFNPASVHERLSKARAWLERYNSSEVIALLQNKNTEYIATLSDNQKKHIAALHALLLQPIDTIVTLEEKIYDIPKDPTLSQKENSPRQRAFFKDVYMLLIGKDTGPRLSTFLWAANRERIMRLL